MPLVSRWLVALLVAGTASCTRESTSLTSPEALRIALSPDRDEATAVRAVTSLGPAALPALKQLVGARQELLLRERALLATAHIILEARRPSATWTVSRSAAGIALARTIQTRNVANQFGELGPIGEARCVGTFELVPNVDLEEFRRRQDEAETVRQQISEVRGSLARRCGRLKGELVDCPPGAREETRSKVRDLRSRLPSLPAYQLPDGTALRVTVTALPWTISAGEGQTDCEAAVVAVAQAVGRPFDARFLFEQLDPPPVGFPGEDF